MLGIDLKGGNWTRTGRRVNFLSNTLSKRGEQNYTMQHDQTCKSWTRLEACEN